MEIDLRILTYRVVRGCHLGCFFFQFGATSNQTIGKPTQPRIDQESIALVAHWILLNIL
jgi:hypothetical protein